MDRAFFVAVTGHAPFCSRQSRITVDYDTSIDWLYGTQAFGIKLGLENIERLLREMELLPLPGETRVVHVAGTNGKGSVCAFTERILRDGGLRTGLFTSPHLVTFRERVRVNGEMISRESVAALLSEIRERVSDWDPHPTFFELTLALALAHFVASDCEVLLLETGMGGRLDATNAIPATVSVITPIGLDHQQWLGETIREIAGEKAGILKPATPVVVADLHPDARDVVGRRALTLGIPCIEAHPLPLDWRMGLAGPHQRENAALAVEAACRIEGDRLTQEGIRESLAATRWPGRFQEVGESLVLDGAHNPEAAIVLRQAWEEQFPEEKAHLIFGAAESKDVVSVFRELLPIIGSVNFVPIRSERRLSAQEMEAAFRNAGGEVSSESSLSLSDALSQAKDKDGRTLVAGSLFLIGEALSLQGDEEYESSLQ